jgi:LysM repeat protein
MKRSALLLLLCAWLGALAPSGLASPAQAGAPSLARTDEKAKKTYKVKYGETLSGIAIKFGMKTPDLLKLNHLKNADAIREGQDLWVIDHKNTAPSPAEALVPRPAPAALPANLRHTVAEGETLAKIAAKYALKVEQLQTWNQLKDHLIQVGQVLALSPATVGNTATEATPKRPTGPLVRERGMGEMIPGASNGLQVALHRTAPVGSYIRVYNGSTGAVVLAKVIGKIPNLSSERKVMIKLSRAACQAIGVIDAHFPVEVSYEKMR